MTEAFVYTFFLVFCRASAMLLTSPVFGGTTPAHVRIGFCGMFAFCMTPLMQPHTPALPTEMVGVVTAVFHELLCGLVIGLCALMLMLAAQMAGTFLDIQIGISSMQILNPLTAASTTLIGQLKFLLAVVLLLILNGHHMMFAAFVKSYEISGGLSLEHVKGFQESALTLFSQLMLLALQIAAPAAAVCVIIDAAAGIVNKAVPQMQVFVVTMPAKILAGVFALAFALPLVAIAVQNGLDVVFTSALRMIQGGK